MSKKDKNGQHALTKGNNNAIKKSNGLLYKDLTESHKKYIRILYSDKSRKWEDRFAELVAFSGRNERTVRRWFGKMGLSNAPEVNSPQYAEAKLREHDSNKTVYMITYAQNATPVHKKFFNRMKEYADFRNGSIHVIAGRYRNATSIWNENNENDEWWADEVLPYLDANRHNIHKYLTILSDVKIQPTAVNPMTGMQGMTGEDSSIFGHPKVQLETIPVLEGQRPKVMMTTGACTEKNYTESNSGKKGEFHHTLGFVIVEIQDNNNFFIRHVTADQKTGNFTDLYYNVTEKGIKRVDTIDAIVLGDIHVGDHDDSMLDKTFHTLMNKLKPNHIILHDVFNGHSISHHDAKDPFKQYEKYKDGTNLLNSEINKMLDWLETINEFEESEVVIVRSNHHDFIDRWLKNVDWKKDIANSLEYVEYATLLLKGDAPKGIVPYVVNKRFPRFHTLDRTESYKIGDWELGNHGDIGSNGSRGSLNQFRKANTKLVVGHYHAPGRKDGALAVGTSTKLRVGYNIGPSSWLQSHVIIHKCGKAQHIMFTGTNNEFTIMK